MPLKGDRGAAAGVRDRLGACGGATDRAAATVCRGGAAPWSAATVQLDELSRCWQEARDGRRRVAMLVGEPGIGKTRLAAEFCRNAHAHEAVVLLGRCYEESLAPYQSFVEALRHYVSECPLDEAPAGARNAPGDAREAAPWAPFRASPRAGDRLDR